MHDLARALTEFSAARALLSVDDRVLVALSGGADSCALLLALCEAGVTVVGAAHFHHGMRGADADADAAFCAALCAHLGVSCTIALGATAGANEAEARAARYNFLIEAATECGATVLATAHTASDQAETVLFRVLRGTGTDGLSGVPVQRALTPTLRLVRPLLFATRAQIEAYCAVKQLQPRHDPTNDNPRYPRSKIRRLLPTLADDYNPRLTEALLRLADNAATDADFLQEQAHTLWEHCQRESPTRLTLDLAPLQTAHRALRRRVLLRALWTLTTDDSTLREELATHTWVERLDVLLQTHGAMDLPGELRVRCDGATLDFFSPNSEPHSGFDCLLDVPGSVTLPDRRQLVATIGTPLAQKERRRGATAIDLYNGPVKLRVRTIQPGDRIAPLGMGGRTRPVRDLLREARVPVEQRTRVVLVTEADTDTVLWIVGVAQAETTRVPSGATEVLRLEIKINAKDDGR